MPFAHWHDACIARDGTNQANKWHGLYIAMGSRAVMLCSRQGKVLKMQGEDGECVGVH